MMLVHVLPLLSRSMMAALRKMRGGVTLGCVFTCGVCNRCQRGSAHFHIQGIYRQIPHSVYWKNVYFLSIISIT